MLDAGLFPWLTAIGENDKEPGYQVFYENRDPARGLLGTVVDMLGSESNDATTDGLEMLRTTRAAGSPGRPLVVILDQAEEAFTRPLPPAAGSSATGPAPQAELALFFTALAGLFDAAQRTRDRLILSFRKEWLTEFQAAARGAGLSWSEYPLTPLDRDEIMAAVEGPAVDPAARPIYRLSMARGLAGEIADDLLGFVADPAKNRESPVAPTLQILLRRMWDEAKRRDDAAPIFDRALYIAVKEGGYGLQEFLNTQLGRLHSRHPGLVDSGLVLDILESHTTSLGTARSCDRADLRARYIHRAKVIDELIADCANLYLLVQLPPPATAETTRLAHDSLAPLIREKFQQSMAPGQRARRLLENRSAEWRLGRRGDPFDESDLAGVESGESGMRIKDPDEGRLVAASRAVRRRRRRIRLAVMLSTIGLLCAALAFGAVAILNGLEAEARLARSYLRGIGQSAPITGVELETLQALSREESRRVRRLFFANALETPAAATQVIARYQEIVDLGVRFDPSLRQEVHSIVLRVLDATHAAPQGGQRVLRAAATLLGLELGSEKLNRGSDFARAAVSALAERPLLGNSMPVSRVVLSDLWGRVRESERIALLEGLVERIGRGEYEELSPLVEIVVTASPCLSEEAARGIDGHVTSLVADADVFQLKALARAAAALPYRAGSAACGIIARRVDLLLGNVGQGAHESLVSTVEALSPLLSDEDARRIASRAADLSRQARLELLDPLARVVAALPRRAGAAGAGAVSGRAVLLLTGRGQQQTLTMMLAILGANSLRGQDQPLSYATMAGQTFFALTASRSPEWKRGPFLVIARVAPLLNDPDAQSIVARASALAPESDSKTLEVVAHAVAAMPGRTGSTAATAVARRARAIMPTYMLGMPAPEALASVATVATLLDEAESLEAAKWALSLVPQLAEVYLDRLARLVEALQGVDREAAADAVVSRALSHASEKNRKLRDPIILAIRRMAPMVGEVSARKISERVTTSAAGAGGEVLEMMAHAAANLRGDSGRLAAEAVASQIATRAADSDPPTLALLANAAAALPGRAGSTAASATCDRISGILSRGSDVRLISAMNDSLAVLGSKLDATRIARVVSIPSVFGDVRRGLIRQLRQEIGPRDGDSWERPWDAVDWLRAHGATERDLARIEELLVRGDD